MRFTSSFLLSCVSVLLATIASAIADGVEQADVSSLVFPSAVAAGSVRVADGIKESKGEQGCIAAIRAACNAAAGVPLSQIERLSLIVDKENRGTNAHLLVLSTTRPVSISSIVPEPVPDGDNKPFLGYPSIAWRSGNTRLCQIDESTLVLGDSNAIRKAFQNDPNRRPPLARALTASRGLDNHVHAVWFPAEYLQRLHRDYRRAARRKAAPDASVLGAMELVTGARLSVNVSKPPAGSLEILAKSETDANVIETEYWDYRFIAPESAFEQFFWGFMRKDNLPGTAQALAAKFKVFSYTLPKSVKVKRVNEQTLMLPLEDSETSPPSRLVVGAAGALITLWIDALERIRPVAPASVARENLRNILRALLKTEAITKGFPPHAIYGNDGKPLLSWRVAMLPQLGYSELHDRFHLDEPWDSPHNRALISEMPDVYFDPASKKLRRHDGKTHFLGVVGEHAVFGGGPRPIQLRKITDGLRNTVAVLQVDDSLAVEWTKPADYVVAEHREDPTKDLGQLHNGMFLAGFADGAVTEAPGNISAEQMLAYLDRDDGNLLGGMPDH
jgi:hypothetical protein